jgi:AraC-like DNA-binding protein
MRDDLKQLTDTLRHNEQPVWRATSEIRRCFRLIGVAVASDDHGSSVSHLAVHLNQLLLAILEMFRRQPVALDASLSSARRTVELLWADLRENPEYLAMEWSVSGMAKRCGMGITNFIQLSRQLTNMTPGQYLNHCRLMLAAQRLRVEPKQSITHIALDCGFASSQYFATLFHRQFNQTPREFRNHRACSVTLNAK